MNEFINKEAIISKVKRTLMPNVDESGMVSVENAERWFIKLLKEQPSADVVEVVRCKNCEHAHTNYISDEFCLCQRPYNRTEDGVEQVNIIVHQNSYCHFGTPRESDNEC